MRTHLFTVRCAAKGGHSAWCRVCVCVCAFCCVLCVFLRVGCWVVCVVCVVGVRYGVLFIKWLMVKTYKCARDQRCIMCYELCGVCCMPGRTAWWGFCFLTGNVVN